MLAEGYLVEPTAQAQMLLRFTLNIQFSIIGQKVLFLFNDTSFLDSFLNNVQVALKFEHRNSKGCNYGPPYEWQVYKQALTHYIFLCYDGSSTYMSLAKLYICISSPVNSGIYIHHESALSQKTYCQIHGQNLVLQGRKLLKKSIFERKGIYARNYVFEGTI